MAAGRAPQRMHWLTSLGLMWWIVWVQTAIAMMVLLVVVLLGGSVLSVLVGSINSILPNVYFVAKLGGWRCHRGSIVGDWIAAEITKLTVVVMLFLAAFLLLDRLDVITCCVAFIVVHMSAVIAAMILDSYSHDQPLRSQ